VTLFIVGHFAAAQSPVAPHGPQAVTTLPAALANIRAQYAVDIVYSDDLVDGTRVVTLQHQSPAPGGDVASVLDAVLAPHGLMAQRAGATWFVVRRDDSGPKPTSINGLIVVRDAKTRLRIAGATLDCASPDLTLEFIADGAFRASTSGKGRFTVAAAAPAYRSVVRSVALSRAGDALSILLEPAGPTQFDNLVVSTSRHGVLRAPESVNNLDAEALQVMPKIGDDPLRLVRRLPGAASGGLSARVHLRGGNDDETALVLDGLRLTDPFHLRDYQSVFSAIDRRVLADVDVYTGAFPASFGDALSGVIEMRTLEPVEVEHELTASFFNLSAFSSGTFADANGDWIVSARRGNLDWVINGINDALGDPDYRDFFGRMSWSGSDRLGISFNLHRSVDDVVVIPEALDVERVEGSTRTRNTHLWTTADQQWTPNLYSRTIMSYTALDNDRTGLSNDMEDVIGSVRDDRRMQTLTLKQDWTWRAGAKRQLRFGGLVSDASTRYRYRSTRQFFDVTADLAGSDERLDRQIDIDVDGSEFAAYLSTRFVPAPRWVVEAGLRWDRQTYTGDDDQWSPRANLLFTPRADRRLRLSLGRFHQSQKVHELQVEDGVNEFAPAERSDQVVLGLEQDIAGRWQIRLEAYYKRLSRVRPRFENLFDPLIILPELAPDRVRIDADDGRVRGAELTLRSIGTSPLSWWASYTRSKATDRFAGRDVVRSWDQPHAFSGGVAWRGKDWELSIAGLYRSGWPTTTVGIDSEGELMVNQRNAERLGDFMTIDLHAARHVDLGSRRLTVFADVINATNRRNACCVGFDFDEDATPPQVVREVDHWLPLIPSLGFRVRF
jgi:hypothetical protein